VNRNTWSRPLVAALSLVAVAGLVAIAGCGGVGSAGKADAAQEVSVKVTPDGFVPAEQTVAHGKPIRLTITRETDQTCARQVVFASLNLKQDLPLHQAVTIDLPAQPAGKLAYACGMDMVHGALVVQ
jgi:plastocyanin domain-containing protein